MGSMVLAIVRLFALFLTDELGGQAGADAWEAACLEADAKRFTFPRQEMADILAAVGNPEPRLHACQVVFLS